LVGNSLSSLGYLKALESASEWLVGMQSARTTPIEGKKEVYRTLYD
jgi:hypothetical protein